jgi:hypothetical protein
VSLKETLGKVSEKWNLDGLNPANPTSEEDLLEKFAALGIALSREAVEVYTNVDGFDEDRIDSECLTFWTVEKILRENAFNAEYVYFADFLIDSRRFAF